MPRVRTIDSPNACPTKASCQECDQDASSAILSLLGDPLVAFGGDDLLRIAEVAESRRLTDEAAARAYADRQTKIRFGR